MEYNKLDYLGPKAHMGAQFPKRLRMFATKVAKLHGTTISNVLVTALEFYQLQYEKERKHRKEAGHGHIG